MIQSEIISWLLDGDVSIQYQTYRDLLGIDKPELQKRITFEGWGHRFIKYQNDNGHWGKGFYQPKWTSTHYTLLDIKNLSPAKTCESVQRTISTILQNEKGEDGGLNPSGTISKSDVCINGMALNYCSYFGADQNDLESVVDFLLTQYMPDGGFNCHSNRKGAVHSSLHTTLCVLEGILEYKRNNYTYRIKELLHAEKSAQEFILKHRLYKSDNTGEIIKPKFLSLSYPSRWKYDILRALDYFRDTGILFDKRMQDAIDIILLKQDKDNTWKLQAHHPGNVHFHMEKTGIQSRWNTLRALRVLKFFGINV